MKKIINILLIAATCVTMLAGAMSCSAESGSGSGGGSGEGKGGSMARFAIMGDYMYIVDHRTLKTIELTDPAHPVYLQYKDQTPGGFGNGNIETIFPDRQRNLIFIGSQAAMYIYDATDPVFLKFISKATHITSCDPVVAYGDYAYVTLNTGNLRCNIGDNALKIFNISDLQAPVKIRSIGLKSPMGLGIDGGRKRLFVCTNGLIMYDITDPENPKPIDDLQNSVGGIIGGIIDSYDVIPMEEKGHVLLVGKDGLYQFDYTTGKFKLLDFIKVNRKKQI